MNKKTLRVKTPEEIKLKNDLSSGILGAKSPEELKRNITSNLMLLSNELKVDGQSELLKNGLSAFAQAFSGSSNFEGEELSRLDTLIKNNRYELVSNQRISLSYLYTTHSIVESLINTPVDDAFKSGITIESKVFSEEELSNFYIYLEKKRFFEKIGSAIKWGRLFGGGGLVIDDGTDNPEAPLNVTDSINMYPADLWEILKTKQQGDIVSKPYLKQNFLKNTYEFYGNELNPSKVLIAFGSDAPSLVQYRLRGWGLSLVERLVRPLSNYLKYETVIFELVDEAKIDVLKLGSLEETLTDPNGHQAVMNRVELAMQGKNHKNALILGEDDEFTQKQMNFQGLTEISKQLDLKIANAVQFPLTKLFGQSATGFNTGKEDLENYNQMVERDVRKKHINLIYKAVELYCLVYFGKVDENLVIKFPPLQVETEEEMREGKNSHAERINNSVANGIISKKEARKLLFDNKLI